MWSSDGGRDDLWGAAVPLSGFALTETLAHRTWLLIDAVDAPVRRTVLESFAYYRWGFEPALIREVLGNFRRWNGAIVYDQVGDDRGSTTYGKRTLTDDERETLLGLLARRIPGDDLGDAGEVYVRAHFKKSNRFESVTPLAKRGSKSAPAGSRRPDLFVTDQATGDRYCVSVKNAHEMLEDRDDRIAEAKAIAAAKGAKPFLVISFATPEAQETCAREGVRLTTIERRIAPRTYVPEGGTERLQSRVLMRELIPAIGWHPWAYVTTTVRQENTKKGSKTIEVSPVREYDADFVARLEQTITGKV